MLCPYVLFAERETPQEKQRSQYNRRARPWEFQIGACVLLLVPDATCNFLARWQGPITVIDWSLPFTRTYTHLSAST